MEVINHTSDNTGTINPLRYRSYYYDHETGYCYLNSRYYDSNIYRFINSDVYVSTGQGVLGHNMFAYCQNNSLNNIDSSGNYSESLQLWIGTMWWLPSIDLILPIGDIAFFAVAIVLYICSVDIDEQYQLEEIPIYNDNVTVLYEAEHVSNARKSTINKHQKGQKRKQMDKRGEKGDSRRQYRGNKRRNNLVVILPIVKSTGKKIGVASVAFVGVMAHYS